MNVKTLQSFDLAPVAHRDRDDSPPLSTSFEQRESGSVPVVRGFFGKGPIGTIAGDMLLFLGMVSDYLSGEYPRLPLRAIAAIVFTLLYIAVPFDLLPDYILGIGQLDDLLAALVGVWLIRQEIRAYRTWKEQRINGSGE